MTGARVLAASAPFSPGDGAAARSLAGEPARSADDALCGDARRGVPTGESSSLERERSSESSSLSPPVVSGIGDELSDERLPHAQPWVPAVQLPSNEAAPPGSLPWLPSETSIEPPHR